MRFGIVRAAGRGRGGLMAMRFVREFGVFLRPICFVVVGALSGAPARELAFSRDSPRLRARGELRREWYAHCAREE